MSERSGQAGVPGEDDRLLGELGAAVRAGQEVPDSFLRVARGAYAWRTVDAEIAALQDDSAAVGSLVRSGTDTGPRAVSFAGGDLTIELELHPDGVRGQVAPAGTGAIRVLLEDPESGAEASRAAPGGPVPVDEVGWFVIEPVPPGRFRLHVRTDLGAAVLTEWITP